MLRDPSVRAVVVVSTAEEMPANETLEIFSGLAEIDLAVAALVVNQVHSAPCDANTLARLHAAPVSHTHHRSHETVLELV